MLHGLPSFAVVELHPVIFPIFDLAGVLQRLGEQLAKIVVVWSVFKAQVPNVAKILVELLCHYVQFNIVPSRYNTETYQEILRIDP